MFERFKERMQAAQKARELAAAARARQERERAQQAEQERKGEQERARRIRSIRVITGDVKYRYAIVDTVRAVGYYELEQHGVLLPDEATDRAIKQLQEKAFAVGADAVIHAVFHIMRYAVQRSRMHLVPAYEVHVFGTAIKVLGPPEE
jgi:uncharacterized protein YbjQ (UPF0145 family)